MGAQKSLEHKEITVPVEFKKFDPEPLGKDCPMKIWNLEGNEDEDSEYESSNENEYEEEELEERVYNYIGLGEEDFKYPSTTIPPVTRSDPFESLEYYTSLIRSQLGRSNQAFASPTVTLAGPVPVILASTITPVNIQINNNRNNCSSVCTQTSLVVAISAGSGIPSSMQVTSDCL